MSDENAVDILKAQHKTLDESVHSLVRAVADIKNIVLDNRERLDRQERKLEALVKGQNALAEATLAGFKRLDEENAATRNDIASLELLIRQRFPEN